MLATIARHDAIVTIRAEHAKVRALLAIESDETLSHSGRIKRGLFPGQDSTVKALIGHLQLWESISLEAAHAFLHGERPWISDGSYDSFEAGAKINLDADAQRREWSIHRCVQSWAQTAASLEVTLENLSDEQWKQAAPYSAEQPEDLGGLLQSLLTAPREKPFEHYANHLP